MRIALVSREYPPATAKGGIGSQTYLKAHGLAARGHDVTVVSHSATRERRESGDGAVRVVRIPGLGSRMDVNSEAVEWLTYSAEVAVEIASLHAREPLDIVDFPEWGGEGYCYLLNRADWNSNPLVVVQIHGPMAMFSELLGWPAAGSDLHRVGTEMEGTSLRLADSVFTSSGYSADWCRNRYGLARDRIPTIHTGVDLRHFAPRAGQNGTKLLILFAGRITRSKGVLELMEAVCRLAPAFPGLRLRMLGNGDPPVLRELRAIAERSGLPEILELAGFVSREELPDELNRACVFAAPSVCEGGPGFVYLEAMACALPVIACEGTGVEEVISPGENGLLVRPGDVDALEVALRQLLSDEEFRRRLGQGARAYAEQEADHSTCIRRLEEFYTEIVARDRACAGVHTT